MLVSLQSFWQNIYLRAILFTLVIVATLWLLDKTQQAWGSFLIAFLVAYLVDPFLVWLQNHYIPRGVGVLLVMAGLVTLGSLGVVLLIGLLLELSSLPVAARDGLLQIPNWLETGAPLWLQNTLVSNQDALSALLNDTLNSIIAWVENNANNIVNQFISGTGAFFTGLFNVFILLVFTAFTLSSYPSIAKALIEFFPKRNQAFARDMGNKLDAAMGGYIRSKMLESMIMFVIASLVLTLLGVPNALALGLVNALLNAVPYAGPLIATAIEALVALTVSWQLALIVLIVMFIIEQIDGNVIGPLLLSKGVNVHPILILSSVIAGGAIFGFWGILLAIPTVAFLQLIYRDYYRTSAWYNQETDGIPLSSD